MPSTVYKGDLTEVTFGHETAMKLVHGGFGTNFKWNHTSTDSSAGTSTIRFSGGGSSTPCESGVLKYPIGMLVGCRLSFQASASFANDDNKTSGKTFTIVSHTVETGPITQIVVTPALTSSTGDSASGDTMIIHGYKLPSMDVNCSVTTAADQSSEKVLTDQFIGLAATVTLPETKVDLKRYHVVGLGRDVAVQVPGKFTNEGGSFEVNLHNPRWLYYALGMEAVDVGATQYQANCTQTDYKLNGATQVGESLLVYDGTGTPTFASGTSTAVAAGDYVVIVEGGVTASIQDIVTYKETTTADGDAFGAVANPDAKYFDRTETSEIRRIVAIDGDNIWLDDALCFPHADNTVLHFVRFREGSTLLSPDRASTGALTNGVTRMLYSRSIVPSFAMEVSIRRNDSDGITTNSGGLGSNTDPKQLTRVFRGCKVKDFSLTADTDAALRMTVNYDAALCYTDTGQLETDTAATATISVSSYGGTANGETLTVKDAAGTSYLMTFNGGVAFGSPASGQIGLSGVGSNANLATAIENGINATVSGNITVSNGGTSLTLTQATKGVAGNQTNATTSGGGLTVGNFTGGVGGAGNRYDTHRMFEDTANTPAKRKESGIAVGTQKPFMFYNGQITLAGVNVGQVVSFTLTGNTGMVQHYTINGSPVTDSETDQVPFSGIRNPAIAVEGKTEYSMDMEIIVDDPVFYHKMRRAVGHDATTANQIRLSFTKAGTAGNRETLTLLVDDYVITEAPLPIPEDKGVIKAPLKIMPKAIRVVATDTLLHS